MGIKIPVLKCPFCGLPPEVIPWHGGAKTKRAVNCHHLECWVNPMVTGPTRAIAVARWNLRAE